MADWRQIQARIRKAKASDDPRAKLLQLFEKTRDAMVAFELGLQYEKSGEVEDAARWYSTAAERFHRADWKKKAEDALVRLAVPHVPAVAEAVPPPVPVRERAELPSQEPTVSLEAAAEPAEAEAAPSRRKGRRRGRRGGRGRRRKKVAQAAPTPTAQPEPVRARHVAQPPGVAPVRAAQPVQVPTIEERLPGTRAGEPAFASRLAQLEAQLRRLIASPVHTLADLDQAPAGPGVFLLSDSDQTTHYYAEACKTLRIGVDLAARSRKGKGSVRARLAEHLGVSDAQAARYLKEHCIVRWLQREEDAPALAHLVVAVLRPVLND